MKINDLLNEIKYGKETYQAMTNESGIASAVIEGNKFIATKRLSVLLEGKNVDDEVYSLIKKISAKLVDYESKIIYEEDISKIYARMKADSILEDYNNILKCFNNKRIYSKYEFNSLGKMLGTIKYALNEIAVKAQVGSRYLKEHLTPAVLKPYIKNEFDKIKQING